MKRKSPPPLTKEHRYKIGRANAIALKGRKLSVEHRHKISEYNKRIGRRPPDATGRVFSEETKRKIGAKNKGKDHWWAIKGEKHHWWKGGITPERTKIHHSKEYQLWRKAVFERDNYICRFCGRRGGYLEADHIKPFSLFPELRFAIDNGRTLCKSCHRKTDTYGAKMNVYKRIKGEEKVI